MVLGFFLFHKQLVMQKKKQQQQQKKEKLPRIRKRENVHFHEETASYGLRQLAKAQNGGKIMVTWSLLLFARVSRNRVA